MRKKYFLLVPLIAIFLTSFMRSSDIEESNALAFEQQTFTKAKIDNFIREAYADNYDVVFNDQRRYNMIVDFFQNRLSYEMNSEYSAKMVSNITDLELSTKYNANQQRDLSFDIDTFNPLKYKFEFSPQKSKIYKLGNTEYYMLVKPIR